MTGILTDALIETLARQSPGPWAFGCIGVLMTPTIVRLAIRVWAVTAPSDRLHRRLLDHAELDFTGGRGDRFL
nr:hypothetical protein [Rhodococcus sp. (in: high G+C Gram-positive bacteria)]